MARGNFTGNCPHCGHHMSHGVLYEMMVGADYKSNFRFACLRCSVDIECDVHSVPEFELSKPETQEQYQARRLKMLTEGNGVK